MAQTYVEELNRLLAEVEHTSSARRERSSWRPAWKA